MGPEGAMGPQGQQGPKGDRGDPGETPAGTFIEARFPTGSDYDAKGRFAIRSRAISETSFRGLFVKIRWESGAIAYMPLEYLVSLWVSLIAEENEKVTPVVSVADGVIEVLDSERIIIRVVEVLTGDVLGLAVLVSR